MVESLSIAGLKQMMTEHKQAPNKELRNFGLIMAAFFGLVLGLLPFLIKKSDYKIWTLILAVLFLIPSFFCPKLLRGLYQIWMLFALILGWIQTRIILTVIYFVLVTPIAFFLRLRKIDILGMKWNKGVTTYRNSLATESTENFEKMY